VLMIN
jgi:hypothetical protein